ncbi:MAG: methyltransferase domain-containing protein [Alphaproteobacteria bacterium]
MHLDVIDLKEFYDSRLGRIARRFLRRRLRAIWPDLRGERLLGLGYATPYLRPFLDEAERTFAIMPSAQGVLHWPVEGPNRTALAASDQLPLPDRAMDRILLVHELEAADHISHLLRESWRVLADSGRLVLIVPNRRGLWGRFDHTPFGAGRPFSTGQTTRLLRDTMFQPISVETALFVPPIRSRVFLSTAPLWEKIGQRFFATFGGAVIVEARKQLYAMTGVEARATRRRRALKAATGVRGAGATRDSA